MRGAPCARGVDMSTSGEKPKASVGTAVGIAVIVAAIVGAAAGYGTTYLTRSTPAPQTREFYVFPFSLGFNESVTSLPHDVFVPDRIVVYRGDTVVIHFYNTEDEPENHTFTMTAPAAVNADIGMGEHADITFVASTAGIFPYTCTYHLPSMAGNLVVLG